jgi:rod shape-determining protein MreC
MLSRGPGQSRFTLALLVVISISVLAVDLLGIGPIGLIRDGVNAALSPVRSVGNAVFGNHDSDEVADLRARIAELEGNEIEAANYRAELQRLLSTLSIDLPEDIDGVPATITSQAVGNFDQTIEIDEGADAGIEVNMPVTDGTNLIGVVDSVTFNSARVLLISNRDLNVGVRHAETNEIAIAHGQGDNEPLIVDSGFDVTRPVSEGDHFLTAGRNGSNFPPDVPVGTAVRVQAADNPLEERVFIQPAADLGALSQVVVLLYHATEAGPSEDEEGGG